MALPSEYPAPTCLISSAHTPLPLASVNGSEADLSLGLDLSSIPLDLGDLVGNFDFENQFISMIGNEANYDLSRTEEAGNISTFEEGILDFELNADVLMALNQLENCKFVNIFNLNYFKNTYKSFPSNKIKTTL